MSSRIEDILAELRTLRTAEDRLAWLVARAKTYSKLSVEELRDDLLVPGCFSKLWLLCSYDGQKCHFRSDSDATIVRAIAGLLCECYSNLPPQTILSCSPPVSEQLGLRAFITPSRKNALSRIEESIANFALTCKVRGT